MNTMEAVKSCMVRRNVTNCWASTKMKEPSALCVVTDDEAPMSGGGHRVIIMCDDVESMTRKTSSLQPIALSTCH